MRAFLLVILLVFQKQEEPVLEFNQEQKQWQFQQVVEMPGISEDVIFVRTKEYISLAYKSGKDVTQSAEKETGKVIVKGYFLIEKVMYQGWLRHNLVIDCRKDKFRVRFDNFSVIVPSANLDSSLEKDGIAGKAKIMKQGAQNCQDFVNGLKKYILDNVNKKDDF